MRTRRRLIDIKAMQALKILKLEERLEQLEEKEFRIKMVDRWTKEDYKMFDEVQREIKEIRKVLNK